MKDYPAQTYSKRMQGLTLRWALEDALWLHWSGNKEAALEILHKVIDKVVKEEPDG